MGNLLNNRIHAVLSTNDANKAIHHVSETKKLFPFLIGLSADEKKGMAGINVSNKQFVDDCLNEMKHDTTVLPGFIKPADVQKDFDLFNSMEKVITAYSGLLAELSDTQYLAGAEAYATCLAYYNLLKVAANSGVPGAQDRYDRLKVRFTNYGGSPGSDQADVPPVK